MASHDSCALHQDTAREQVLNMHFLPFITEKMWNIQAQIQFLNPYALIISHLRVILFQFSDTGAGTGGAGVGGGVQDGEGRLRHGCQGEGVI